MINLRTCVRNILPSSRFLMAKAGESLDVINKERKFNKERSGLFSVTM